MKNFASAHAMKWRSSLSITSFLLAILLILPATTGNAAPHHRSYMVALVAARSNAFDTHAGNQQSRGTWAKAGTLIFAASEALVLNDGRVFVPPSAFTVSKTGPQIWDPATNVWKALPQSKFGRLNSASAVLKDGRVLVTGGQASPQTAELFNPTTGQWKLTKGAMVVGRYLHRATRLIDGRVLLTSGCIQPGCAAGTTSAEIYDPAADRFTKTGSMKLIRTLHTATVLANGRVLVAGGYTNTGTGVTDLAEVYNPTSGSWSFTGTMSVTRSEHTATLLRDGRVLVTGGSSDSGLLLATAEVYNPTSGTWSSTGQMPYVRSQHSAVLLLDGRVLVAGGLSIMRRAPVILASAEIWSPNSGTFTKTASMSMERSQFGLALVRGGRALAVGGDDAVIGPHQYFPGDAETYRP